MVHDPDEHLIKAHEDRMEGLETWCNKLEISLRDQRMEAQLAAKEASSAVKEAQGELKTKASTSTVMWGVGILMAILGVIWWTVIDNGRVMHYVQRNQDLVLRELKINPVK